MRTDIYAGLAVAAVSLTYLLWVLGHPIARCWRCLGRKIRRTRSGRAKPCLACKGHGAKPPPLAGPVHSFYWSVFGDRIRDRQKAAVSAQVSARKQGTGR